MTYQHIFRNTTVDKSWTSIKGCVRYSDNRNFRLHFQKPKWHGITNKTNLPMTTPISKQWPHQSVTVVHLLISHHIKTLIPFVTKLLSHNLLTTFLCPIPTTFKCSLWSFWAFYETFLPSLFLIPPFQIYNQNGESCRHKTNQKKGLLDFKFFENPPHKLG